MTESTKFIGDIDFAELYFAPVAIDKSRKSVAMYMSAKNTTYNNRVRFQLVEDEDSPVVSKWNVDTAVEDADPSRLKQTVLLNSVVHKKTIDKLHELDKMVQEEAVKKSKEWWKKELPAEAISYKYKPLIAWDEKSECYAASYKVIVPHPRPELGKKYGKETPIYKISDEGDAVVSDHRILTQGSEMTPQVSTVGVWFMGDNQFGVSLRAEVLLCKTMVVPSPLDSLKLKRKYREVEAEPAAKKAASGAPPEPVDEDDEPVM